MRKVTHWEDDPDNQALLKSASGGKFSTWLYERSRARDRALVAESPRWHQWLFWQVPLRFLLYVGAVWGAAFIDRDSWWSTVAFLVIAVIAAQGVLGGIARAQSYRNGWTDRGKHDMLLHAMVCGDPVAQDKFERATLDTNMDAFRRG